MLGGVALSQTGGRVRGFCVPGTELEDRTTAVENVAFHQDRLPNAMRHTGNPGDKRPFWSVMIPVYNRTEYLSKTLESVLEQDPGPEVMQIEVVDGNSTTGDPAALVRQVAGDRVSVFRHTQPLRMHENWNSCIERARGEWVHILHSDDFVLNGFYSRLGESLAGCKDVGAAFCRCAFVDEEGRRIRTTDLEQPTAGILAHGMERLAVRQRIIFPSIVVRKEAYEQVGGFRGDLCFALDWEMWVRLAARYPFWYEPAALACYRIHGRSETARLRYRGEELADKGRAISIIAGYLPSHSRAREALAVHALGVARSQFVARQVRAALGQLRSALRIRRSLRVIGSTFQVLVWTCFCSVRAALKTLTGARVRGDRNKSSSTSGGDESISSLHDRFKPAGH